MLRLMGIGDFFWKICLALTRGWKSRCALILVNEYATDLPERPILLSPRAGEVLKNPRPLLVGVAQPATDVAILVNREVVAAVRADLAGDWSFRLVEPLPTGAVALAAACMAEERPEQMAAPIVVTVMPNAKVLAARPPQSLAEKPPVKLYYSVPTGP
jgi:hypothetical protein